MPAFSIESRGLWGASIPLITNKNQPIKTMNTILADKLDNRKGYAHDNVIDTIMNKKLSYRLEDLNSSLKQVAFQIRTAADYQNAVDYYRARMKDFSPRTIGHQLASERLQHLPMLMNGYKEKFILQTF